MDAALARADQLTVDLAARRTAFYAARGWPIGAKEEQPHPADELFDRAFPSGLRGDGQRVSITEYARMFLAERRVDAATIWSDAEALARDLAEGRLDETAPRFAADVRATQRGEIEGEIDTSRAEGTSLLAVVRAGIARLRR